ncbi:MAG: endonuclease/exonuclease/phosphatase family protein [Isosphaeraceae bacterium]
MRSTRIARTVITRPFVAALLFGLACSSARAEPPARPEGAIRIATFNASLNRDKPGQLLADLGTPDNVQARNVAEVIQRVRPDILLINEFDHDPDGKAAALFQTNYLARGQNGAEPIAYAYRYTDGVNTGVASGVDLDHDGRVASEPGSRGYGNDAFGFGLFPASMAWWSIPTSRSTRPESGRSEPCAGRHAGRAPPDPSRRLDVVRP